MQITTELNFDDSRNLLVDKVVTNEEAAAIVARTKGTQATTSPHHFEPSYLVWVFRPTGWYVKFYFTEDTIIISFHRSE